jgi:hypothetical protein
MAAALIPSNSTLSVAGQATLTGYIVEQDNRGGTNIDFEDIMDHLGAFHTRIVFEKRMKKIDLTLLVLAGTPATEFPEGAMCTLTGLTDYFVDSAVISNTKSARRVTVSLTRLLNLA